MAGVLEFYPVIPLLGLIKKVQPRANTLNIFFDESETSHAVLARFQNEMLDPEIQKFGFHIGKKVVSNDQSLWGKGLTSSNPNTDVNLIFPFSNVRDPKQKSKSITSSEFANWITEKSKTLEFATASLTLNFPFFATVGIKGKEHGEDAAEQARLLLSRTKDLKVAIGKYARLNFNMERAKALQVQIPFEILAYSHSLQQTEKKNE
jgi:ABC-type uncharacterized transport system substrate-binding protein